MMNSIRIIVYSAIILLIAGGLFSRKSMIAAELDKSDIKIEVRGEGKASVNIDSKIESSDSASYSQTTKIMDQNGVVSESTVIKGSGGHGSGNPGILSSGGNGTVKISSGNSKVSVTLGGRLRGRILLQVEGHGEAWYVDPDSAERVFLGRPDDAFAIMRSYGLGITDNDLGMIPESDRQDADAAGPTAKRLAGKILLQVQQNGEAWYVNPLSLKRHYLGRPADAFRIMRELGLGITDKNLGLIVVRE
jgi:hypothetical protein